MQHESALRAIASRLIATPVEELPRIVGFLATSLSQCSLEDHFSETKKASNPSVTTHKIKTRITSLLQDRSTAGRLSAAVLIKTVVDTGGLNVLSHSEVWARGLLTCLNKPDPSEVKQIYLAAVTRIFILTQTHPTLLREVTTPLLPPFISACLSLLRPVKAQVRGKAVETPSPLLEPVLQCWIQLLPQHATTFRPFVTRIRLICLQLLEEDGTFTLTSKLIPRLMCLLISCAPKNTTDREWAQAASNIISSAHETTDKLFRAVLEEHEPNDNSNQRLIGKQNFSKEPKIVDKDQLGLSGWTGISAGSARLVMFIEWLGNLISVSTTHNVTISVGSILDLTSRILVVTPPHSRGNAVAVARYHNEVTRDEKELLWLHLPEFRVACIRLLRKLNTLYGQSLLPVASVMINQVLDSFEATSAHEINRQVTYTFLHEALASFDFAQMKVNKSSLASLIEKCCIDLKSNLPDAKRVSDSSNAREGFLVTNTSTAENVSLMGQSPVYLAAWNLLPGLLRYCPDTLVSRQSRIELDRLSIVLDHKEAMLASVMCPLLSDKQKATTATLLPFLARSATDELSTEALLRPRMPIIRLSGPLNQNSKMDEPSVSDQQQEGGTDQDDDILSKLEDSIDAMEQVVNTEQPITESNNVAEHINIDKETPSVIRKRPLDDYEDTTDADVAAHVDITAPRELKMPRLEKKAMAESSVQIDPAASIQLGRIEAGSSSIVVGSASSANQISHLSTSSEQVLRVDDSDSDDSEIPQIDPGFDTDEEQSE